MASVLIFGPDTFILNLNFQIIGSLVEFDGNMFFLNHSGSGNGAGTGSVALHLLSFGQIRFHYGLKVIFALNNGM